MIFSDETLMAYADAELAEPERAEIERAVRADPTVAAKVARHRALRGDVAAAFAPIVDEAVPPRLVAAALPGKVADLGAVRAARAGVTHPAMAMVAARAARAAAYHDQRRDWSWREWGGLAATLALGLLLGSLLAGDGGVGGVGGAGGVGGIGASRDGASRDGTARDGAGGTVAADNAVDTAAASAAPAATVGVPTVASAGGAVVAKGPLANALSRQMGGAGGGSVDIGVSFFAKDGTLCRSFVMSESAGLACRSGDQWKLVMLTPSADQGAGDQRKMGVMPAAVLDAIDARIIGSPLDDGEEYAARLRGWKR
jgi:hypothetical protein